EAFAGRVFADTVGLMTTAMSSIGDRLGLFKELAARGPATSVELAERAGIDARYAREWLNAMASAGYLIRHGRRAIRAAGRARAGAGPGSRADLLRRRPGGAGRAGRPERADPRRVPQRRRHPLRGLPGQHVRGDRALHRRLVREPARAGLDPGHRG